MAPRTRTVLFAVLAVTLLAISAVAVLNRDRLLDWTDAPFLIGFDINRAEAHVKELIKWGPRMSGTEAELNGALYIQQQFIEAGLTDVHIENYTISMFEVMIASMSLVQYMPMGNVPRPNGDTVEFQHMTEFVVQGYSGSRSWGGFRDDLELVNIGDGSDPSTFSRARGKACFIEQTESTPSNWELYDMAADAGVEAVILQNLFQGEKVGFLPFFKSGPDLGPGRRIPVLMVGKDAGDDMIRRSTYKLRLELDVLIEDRPIRVVVGDIIGSGDDIYVFTAHHDTCYNTVGAIDNTVGPATLIEIARAMVSSGKSFRSTVRFATFGGEEEGLFGSIAYYDAHRSELSKNCKAVLNFDMAHVDARTSSSPMTCTDNGTISSVLRYRDLLIKAEPTLAKYEINGYYSEMQTPYSDFWPFVMDGAAGIAAWGSGCYEYHTYKDDISRLNPESLQIWGRILGSYALEAST